jgi:hypothetical protein
LPSPRPSRSIRNVPSPGNPPPSLRWPAIRTAAFAAALLAGATANVTRDSATWLGVRGPQCPLGACLGPLACPGCGLLRSTAAALQGDFALAWATHPAGLATAALLVLGTVLHFDILRRRRELPAHRRWRRVGHVAFAVSLFAGWSVRFLLN